MVSTKGSPTSQNSHPGFKVALCGSMACLGPWCRVPPFCKGIPERGRNVDKPVWFLRLGIPFGLVQKARKEQPAFGVPVQIPISHTQIGFPNSHPENQRGRSRQRALRTKAISLVQRRPSSAEPSAAPRTLSFPSSPGDSKRRRADGRGVLVWGMSLEGGEVTKQVKILPACLTNHAVVCGSTPSHRLNPLPSF